MTTLKQKLPRIPSPIREMIVENTIHEDGRLIGWDRVNTIASEFHFATALHIPDHDFWAAINDEIMLMP